MDDYLDLVNEQWNKDEEHAPPEVPNNGIDYGDGEYDDEIYEDDDGY